MFKQFFVKIKIKALAINDYLKKIEQIPFRGFYDEYECQNDSKDLKPAPRTNNVKVEDLRPQEPADN